MSARAAEVYDLQLERVRLRAIAARRRRDGDHAEHAKTRDELARLEAALGRLRVEAGEALPDRRLASLLRLSAAELDLMWSVVAATMDPSLGPHLRELVGGEARGGMSIALHAILAGLDPGAARSLALALTPLHPLLRYALVEASHDGVPAVQPLTVPARVAGYLAGADAIDEAVLRAGGVVRVEQAPCLDAAQLACVKQIVQALAGDAPVVVVIEGPAGVGKRTAAALAALATQRRAIGLDVGRLAPAVAALEHAFVALRRECLLDDALPLVARVEELAGWEGGGGGGGGGGGRGGLQALARLLDETPISLVLTSELAGIELGTERAVLRVTMPVPDAGARAELWRQALGEQANTEAVELQRLAARYRLGAGGIQRATAAARRRASGGSLATADLVQGVREGIAERFGSAARRVEVAQGWDDLVLAADTLDQLGALVARVRHADLVLGQWGFGRELPRPGGTAALFSGPPGTGKTMAAGIVARELELELYRVDLSRVAAASAEETRQLLARLFDTAGTGHVLLLFHEADHLLPHIESLGGVSIFTTSRAPAIPPALRGQLAAHVAFSPPDAAARAALWRRMLPASAPRTEPLDFEALARQFPDLAGGNIRNAALAGAFLAASDGEGGVITQQHLERAARGEYRAMGRVIG